MSSRTWSARSVESGPSSAPDGGPGELGQAERWISIVGGVVLTVAALRRGGLVTRLVLGAVGISALARGSTGYCAVKAAAKGDVSFADAVREQWQRLRIGGAAGLSRPAASIDSLDILYAEELHALIRTESAIGGVIDAISPRIANAPLRHELDGYAEELRARREDLLRLLGGGVPTSEREDASAIALVGEVRTAMQISGPALRDAGVAAAIQRLLHYKIAGYGTLASYARSLGRDEPGSRLGEYAGRDRALAAELNDLSVRTLNPQATVEGRSREPAPSLRPDLRMH